MRIEPLTSYLLRADVSFEALRVPHRLFGLS